MEWFEEWFGEEYLRLYPHRDDTEAERACRSHPPNACPFSRGGGCSTWPAGRGAMREPFKRLVPGAPGSISR